VLPTIDTPRLQLRPLTVDDAEAIHQAYGDPEAMRFWDLPAADDVAETARRVEVWSYITPDFHAAWGIELKHEKALAGVVNYNRREPWHRRLEVGYILARPYWHQGLAYEAMSGLLDYCIQQLDTHRIEATIEPGNTASIRLIERLGFKREGDLLRDRIMVAGEFRSVCLYALLATEWRR
jgi:[ribosomal protein S5]-alanine N-acetyltransferase